MADDGVVHWWGPTPYLGSPPPVRQNDCSGSGRKTALLLSRLSMLRTWERREKEKGWARPALDGNTSYVFCIYFLFPFLCLCC